MRIFTITSNDLGISWGPAVHFLELWNALQDVAPSIEVAGVAPCWTNKPPIVKPRFPLRMIRVPNIGAFRQVVYDALVAATLVMRRRRYDVVYLRRSQWHLLQICCLWFLNIPLVVELNGLVAEDSASSGGRRLSTLLIAFQERWLIRHAAACIAVSDGIAAAVRQRYSPKGIVVAIRNGVAAAFFRRGAGYRAVNPAPQVIYVGTFTSWDGADRIIALARNHQSATFHMIGDGPARSALEARATTNVAFLGTLPYASLPDAYSRADCAIVLYETERHQNVTLSSLKTLEYVASGLPVFTTDVPGQEFINELGVGMLVGPREDIDLAFSTFLGSLPKYRASYQRVGADLEQRLGWHGTATRTTQVLKQISN